MRAEGDRTQVSIDPPPSSEPSSDGARRQFEPEALVTAAEIARRLGVTSHRTVHDFRLHQIGFPEPVGRIRSFLWYWPDVKEWADSHAAQVAHYQRRGHGEQPAAERELS